MPKSENNFLCLSTLHTMGKNIMTQIKRGVEKRMQIIRNIRWLEKQIDNINAVLSVPFSEKLQEMITLMTVLPKD